MDKWFGESGDRAKHVEFVRAQVDDPHSLALIGSFDSSPATFFEVYWCLGAHAHVAARLKCAEDRLSNYYSAQPYDRGLHLFVGSERHRGPGRVDAWMTSVIDYIFRDEARTERIFIEPHWQNEKVIGHLEARLWSVDDAADVPSAPAGFRTACSTFRIAAAACCRSVAPTSTLHTQSSGDHRRASLWPSNRSREQQ